MERRIFVIKLLKVIAGAVILSLILSLLFAVINYTPMSNRSPDTYYFSIVDSFVFSAIYLTPVGIAVGIIAYLLYGLFKKRTQQTKLTNALVASAISISIIASTIALIIYVDNKINVTNDIYLVPEGYEGDVFVFYNVKGAPPVETEDGYEVHTINEEGYFVTSTPDLDYGTVTDQYFYVDEEGNRTPIDRQCVSLYGTSGTESEGYSLIFTGFKLTTTQCGEDFMVEGFDSYENSNVIVRKLLKQYYDIEAWW